MADPTASFLGTGWNFPPEFSRESFSVDMAVGEVDIHESLNIIFSTSIGERIMVPQFGTDLWRKVFDTLTTTLQTEIAASVRQSVLMWEPRIDVLGVTTDAAGATDGIILVSVDYVVRLTNSRANFVYPFYLQEGTLAPPAS